MTDPDEQVSSSPPASGPAWRLWDHIGVLSGWFLGFIVFAFLVFLAIRGFAPALTLVVVIVAGFLMIVIGGKLGFGRR